MAFLRSNVAIDIPDNGSISVFGTSDGFECSYAGFVVKRQGLNRFILGFDPRLTRSFVHASNDKVSRKVKRFIPVVVDPETKSERQEQEDRRQGCGYLPEEGHGRYLLHILM
jgi:hypothetical protein